MGTAVAGRDVFARRTADAESRRRSGYDDGSQGGTSIGSDPWRNDRSSDGTEWSEAAVECSRRAVRSGVRDVAICCSSDRPNGSAVLVVLPAECVLKCARVSAMLL